MPIEMAGVAVLARGTGAHPGVTGSPGVTQCRRRLISIK